MATDPTTPDSADKPPTAPEASYADRIRALVDAAPPLSPRQRERLRQIFASARRDAVEPPEPPEGDDGA